MIKDKVALVTGAGSGLGKSIAEKFAKSGAIVAIADMNLDSAQATKQEIENKGGKALALSMNVTSEADVNEGINTIIKTYGQLDILVSNAGIQHIDPIKDLSFADWKKVLAVHLDGSFLTAKAAMNAMINQGNGGSLIFMGSIHSKLASPLKAPYVTAKHGILGLSRALAKEGAQYNIRSNVICPGFVRTPLVDKQIPEQAKDLNMSEEEVIEQVILKDTVDHQFTTVDDIAEAALFLASFETNALTGQSINVSHGWCMS